MALIETILRTQEIQLENYGPLTAKNPISLTAVGKVSSPTWANRANIPWIHLPKVFRGKQPNNLALIPYALGGIRSCKSCVFRIYRAKGRNDTLQRVAKVSGTTSHATLSALPYRVDRKNTSTIGVTSYGVTSAVKSAHWFGSCNVTDYAMAVTSYDTSGNSGKAMLALDMNGFPYLAIEWVTSAVTNKITRFGVVLTGW